jgi:hypothetical protein
MPHAIGVINVNQNVFKKVKFIVYSFKVLPLVHCFRQSLPRCDPIVSVINLLFQFVKLEFKNIHEPLPILAKDG